MLRRLLHGDLMLLFSVLPERVVVRRDTRGNYNEILDNSNYRIQNGPVTRVFSNGLDKSPNNGDDHLDHIK